MGLAPYALSVHHFISSVGADAGFASIIGLAILVLLYFAQARETASLREQAELAAQRVAQLESRLAHAAAVQAPASPAFVPSPVPGVAPPPNLIPGRGNQPGSAFAATGSPAPPAGVGAPPLSAATKLIPTPSSGGFAGGVVAAGIAGLMGRSPVAAPGQPGPATPGQPSPGAPAQPGAIPGSPPDPVQGGAPGAAPGGPATSSPPGTPPPMNRIVTPRPATAAAGAGGFGAATTGATATNGTGEHPVLPPPIPPRPPVQIRPGLSDGGSSRPRMLADLDQGGGSPSDLTRVLMALAAVAVVAAIVIVLISVTSGGGNSGQPSSNASTPPSNALTVPTHHHASARKPTAVNPASVTVAVLNGTAVYHLADDVAAQLGAAGFNKGTVANAATQTQPSTTVEYMPGDTRDAQAVAKALKLTSSSVQAITPDVQTLCAQQTASCGAQVVVTLGADLASTSTQTTTAG